MEKMEKATEQEEEQPQISDKVIVVPELPTQPYNQVKTDKGEDVTLITISDALTEIFADIKEIKRAVV